MPRGRGGPRQGTVGTAYNNRTDLQTAKPLPIATSPHQTYGQQTAQMAAQKQVPIAAPPAVPAAPAPPPASGAGTAGGGVLAHTSPEPGELPFTGPSSRPNEPLTAGLPQGPGPGPEALTGIGAMAARSAPQDTATKLLATLAMQPTAGSQLRDIARIAAITGH